MSRPLTLRAALGVCATAVLLASTPAAEAGSLQIGPIKVSMVGKERASTVTVRNTGSVPTNLQVRTVDWSQPEGEDVYTPSTALIASPPQATLAPDEAQTVRLVLQNVPSARTERAWRLIVDEIPNRAQPAGAGVQTSIRALIPVFLSPAVNSRARLRWTAAQTSAGLVVTAYNDGEAHEHLTALKIQADGRELTGSQGLEGYVLSRAKRSWTLAGAPSGAKSMTASAEGLVGAVKAQAQISH